MIEKVIPLLLTLIVASYPVPVFAQPPPAVEPITDIDLEVIIERITNWIFFIFFALAVIFVVFAAFNFLTAAGDPDKAKSARNQLTYAIIAIAVALIARVVPVLVRAILAP